MTAEIWGQRLSGFTERYPKDWRQAIKERFAPKWFLKLFPVQCRTIKCETVVVFPEWVPHVDLGKPAVLHILDHRIGLFDCEIDDDDPAEV